MTDAVSGAPADGGALSVSDAVGLLAAKRNEPAPSEVNNAAREAMASAAAEREQPEGAPQPESAPDGADAAPPQETSGETEGDSDPVSEPPLAPPRSWSKADKAIWDDLPRERQERLLELDRSRELEVRRGQNEAAEKLKALAAKEEAAEQARLIYEKALPNVLASVQSAFTKDFPDIKSQDDLVRLSQTNPARYLKFRAIADQAQAVHAEAQRAEQRRQSEEKAQNEAFIKAEDIRFLEQAPEFADPKTSAKAQAEAGETLLKVGFTDEELQRLWNGAEKISFRDHRLQLLLRSAARYEAAQKAREAAKAKPAVPPVLRPGTAPAKGEQKAGAVQDAQNKLARTGSVKDAVALLRARRAG